MNLSKQSYDKEVFSRMNMKEKHYTLVFASES
jgi:hypothetical protein